METINKKLLGFAGFLAAFIALVMIGGIWFGSSWIPSPWFWLIAVGCLAGSMLCLIVWRIDSAYSDVELEPGDLADDEEAEMNRGAPKPAPRPVAAAIAKAKQPMKVAGVIQKQVTKQPAPASKQATVREETKVMPKPEAKALAFPAKPAEARPTEQRKPDDKATKLASQLASITPKELGNDYDDAAVGKAIAEPAKRVKLNRKNLQMLISVYREEGYHAVSFSKFRGELGIGKDKEALKLKKLLLEAVAMGFLAKKGSRYIIQREDQEPLE